jgi:hypothetical protein
MGWDLAVDHPLRKDERFVLPPETMHVWTMTGNPDLQSGDGDP